MTLRRGYIWPLVGSVLFCSAAQAQGVITTIAGTDWIFPQGPLPALSAPLGQLAGVASSFAVDASGAVYVADSSNCIVAKVTPNGVLSVVAGNGICAENARSGDGGLATSAALSLSGPLTLDQSGNLYIRDRAYIRKVNPKGVITTIAGTGQIGSAGDHGPAANAQLAAEGGLAVDSAGNLYLAEYPLHRVRKIDTAGIITTIAGTGVPGDGGDNGPGTSALLNFPASLALDSKGNLLIADQLNGRIRQLSPAGVISTVVPSFSARGLAVDGSGAIYAADPVGRVYRVNPGGQPVLLAGGDGSNGFSGDNGPAISALLSGIEALAVDSKGDLFISDSYNFRLRKISGGTITTVAGNGGYRYSGENQPAISSTLNRPLTLALDAAGRLYICEENANRVQRVQGGVMTTFAGDGLAGITGNGGPATSAGVSAPTGIAFDATGTLYIADFYSTVRKVNPSGTISTFAPTGSNPPFFEANGIALDAAGSLYVTDGYKSYLYRSDNNGVVTPIAGTGTPGFSGDGGNAVKAALNLPTDVAVDPKGNIYIADSGNQRVRLITPDGKITTFAGPGTNKTIQAPRGLSLDPAGNLYVAEGAQVQKISINGTVTTVAGTGRAQVSPCRGAGDGGPATSACFNFAIAALADASGNIYIADSLDHRVRQILATAPTMAVAPNSISFSGNSQGAITKPQILAVTGSIPGLPFSAGVDTKGTGNWLSVTPGSDRTPRQLEVTADPSQLQPGNYSATITIVPANALPAALPINVKFSVGAAQPPQLEIDKNNFSFTYASGSDARSDTLTVSNAGGGKIGFTAVTSTNSGGNWLTVAPAAGEALPGKPVLLRVTADPKGLIPGTYTGAITLNVTGGPTQVIPVNMTISALTQAILLSQTGLSFTAVNKGGPVPSQSFAVLNAGAGIVKWTVSTSTLAGGGWLAATPGAGSSDSSQTPSLVTVSVNGVNLSPGAYYGQVRIDAPGSANTPQVVTVFLEVLPAGSDPGPMIQPSELVFTISPGTGGPSSQNLQVFNVSGAPLSYRAATSDILLLLAPGDAVLPANQPLSIVVQPQVSSPSAATKTEALTFQFSDGRVQTVRITIVQPPAPQGSSSNPEQRSAGATASCAPTQLMPALSTIGQSFQVTAGWPVALGVNVADDCGNPLASGSVTVSFSNGDPPLSLRSLNNGTWQATWHTGVTATSAPVTVTVRADDSSTQLSGTRQVTGGFRSQQDPPLLDKSSVVSAAGPLSFVPLAPGGMISIYGSRLADNIASAASIPLPTQLGNAQVIVAGQIAPLLYASDSQINAVVPSGVNINTTQQVVVQRGLTYSQPVPIDVAGSQPAIFVSAGAGIFIAYRSDGTPPFLVTANAPAQIGDVLVAYCAGLGATNPAVPDGTASPSSPIASTVNPVSVTIGGQNAPVPFAGLVPGFVGLFQINTQVPSGVQSGSVAVQITVAGQVSPTVPIAIR